jgi:exopolyphosphatase/guanosine-5'-triphosphate,3'-diphosphate pyrophosphatase
MIIAALDIGSNSIHLVVAETDREKPFRVLASAKEMVRLGRSAARDRRLSADAMERALTTLKKFRQKAEGYGASEILAAATSAVRDAENRQEFLARAAAEAGVRIDLLSGSEEARLIALAVSARVRARSRQRVLVIDIGGGSTELAVTQNSEPLALLSLKLGAVRQTQQFITNDPLSEKQLRRLRTELRAVIARHAPEITAAGFDICYGTSGTINALSRIAMHHHLQAKRTSRRAGSFTLDELRAINEELAPLTLAERAQAPGLNRARAEIIVAGGQLLEALLETLQVNEVNVCDWALREGLIVAHLARRSAAVMASAARLERDPSLRGALALAAKYQADVKHAQRSAFLAQQLFEALRPLHTLGGEHLRLLLAAAILHDIGYFVAPTNHHKHSAYLIQNSELTGFTAAELALIANIARYHRSSLPKAKHPYYSALPAEERAVVRKLAAILRIADALDRDHEGRVKGLTCEFGKETVRLIAACTRASETAQWRVEERADLFSEEFGRKLELIARSESAEG